MPTHAEKRRVPYSADQMYALIADIESYPDFLPWCAGARIRNRRQTARGEVVEADLIVSFRVYRESFSSRVMLQPDRHNIDVHYMEGPFRYLNNHWRFKPISETECEVDFFVDFELRSRLLQSLIGVVFNEAMRRIVRASSSGRRRSTAGGPCRLRADPKRAAAGRLQALVRTPCGDPLAPALAPSAANRRSTLCCSVSRLPWTAASVRAQAGRPCRASPGSRVR